LLDIARVVELLNTGSRRGIAVAAGGAAAIQMPGRDVPYLGALTCGAPADVTVIDPDVVRTVDPRKFYSQGKNTPFRGMELKGWPCMTIVGGRIVARDGHV